MTSGITQSVMRNPGWWRRRTKFEKNLIILAGLITCVTIVLAAALAVVVSKNSSPSSSENESLPFFYELRDHEVGKDVYFNKSENTDDICLTPGCIHAASHVLKTMDSDVDPCEDFYSFACGKFLETTIIPDDKSSVTSFSVITDVLQEQLRTMVDTPLESNEQRPFALVKNLFKACMNKSIIEDRGLEPVKKILREMGGWPALEGSRWKEPEFSWQSSVYKFKEQGFSVDYFIDFSVSTNSRNSTYRSIYLDQASLGLSREYLSKGLNESLVLEYHKYHIDIAVLFGADKKTAEEELKEALDFEISLANISLPSEKRRNITKLYNPMTVEKLQETYPSIPWLEYINKVLSPSASVGNNEEIIVVVPSYLQNLEKILSTTPKRVMANYVMTRAAASTVTYLTKELRDRQLQFSTKLTGKTEREVRWKECVDIVSGGLSLSVGSLYIHKYFNEAAKKNALEMVEDIRETFLKMLSKIDWMDDYTRSRAIEKAKSMVSHIAYPDELLDVTKLDEFYEKLYVDPEFYLESILNLTKFGTNYSFGRLREPVNKTSWITHGRPALVNAFYSAIENSIQFPAGILQGYFFNAERPRYMNYGAIGFVIGHEITHGFDDQGRQFDKDGNLNDWWETKTKDLYINKTKCIINQYASYKDVETGLNLNGIKTQGENIADNGGIKEAYYAYNAWVERNGHEKRLPGLKEYSPQQLFWLSAAQSWCSKYRVESLKQRITTGVHSPGRYRVIGPFSNMEEFSKDYKCPRGSNMNPLQKCQVW